jgi:DNA-binding transcriptional LysR family regulator
MPLESDTDISLDLQTLRIVRAIAETGSITGAARALGTTQPAISQHLHRAERRLSMTLVVKQGRSVELTDIGVLLSRHAGGVLDALQAASIDLAGAANLRSGRVRLVGFPSASSTIVPHLLSGMRERHPGVTVQYTESEPPEATELVVAGDADVALIFTYPGGRDSTHHPDPPRGLWTADLFVDPLFVLMSRDHPLVELPRLPLEDLEDDSWIAGCPRCSTHLVRACEGVGYAPNIVYETDNFSATVGMVAADLGIALVPRLTLGTTLLPPNVAVKKLDSEITRTISLVVPADKLTLPAVAALVDAITAIDGMIWRLRTAGDLRGRTHNADRRTHDERRYDVTPG